MCGIMAAARRRYALPAIDWRLARTVRASGILQTKASATGSLNRHGLREKHMCDCLKLNLGSFCHFDDERLAFEGPSCCDRGSLPAKVEQSPRGGTGRTKPRPSARPRWV